MPSSSKTARARISAPRPSRTLKAKVVLSSPVRRGVVVRDDDEASEVLGSILDALSHDREPVEVRSEPAGDGGALGVGHRLAHGRCGRRRPARAARRRGSSRARAGTVRAPAALVYTRSIQASPETRPRRHCETSRSNSARMSRSPPTSASSGVRGRSLRSSFPPARCRTRPGVATPRRRRRRTWSPRRTSRRARSRLSRRVREVPSGPRYATFSGSWSASDALMTSRYTARMASGGKRRPRAARRSRTCRSRSGSYVGRFASRFGLGDVAHDAARARRGASGFVVEVVDTLAMVVEAHGRPP